MDCRIVRSSFWTFHQSDWIFNTDTVNSKKTWLTRRDERQKEWHQWASDPWLWVQNSFHSLHISHISTLSKSLTVSYFLVLCLTNYNNWHYNNFNSVFNARQTTNYMMIWNCGMTNHGYTWWGLGHSSSGTGVSHPFNVNADIFYIHFLQHSYFSTSVNKDVRIYRTVEVGYIRQPELEKFILLHLQFRRGYNITGMGT